MSLSLYDREWGAFAIEDIAEIKSGVRLTKAEMMTGNKPFIGASDSNNGITAFISNTNKSEDRNILGINYNGSVVENFYHPYAALFSDDVKRFCLKNNVGNKLIYLFIKNCILQQKSKYQYAYKFNGQRLKRQKVLLPVTSNGDPDWQFMEDYMREIETRKLKEYQEYIQKRLNNAQFLPEKSGGGVAPLSEQKWQEFEIRDIAEIKSGKDIYEQERFQGAIPYVSSSSVNNGIGHFIGNINETLEANCVSVNRNGSVGYAFYHPYETLYSNDCRKLRLHRRSKYVSLFIANQITFQKDKYGYGYKMGTARLKRQKVLLPTTPSGKPDWEYMEAYMRNLEQSELAQYL